MKAQLGDKSPAGMVARKGGLSLLLLLIAIGCSRSDDISSPLHTVNVETGYVTFEVRWRAISQTGSIRMPKLNTVSGICVRETRTCQENIARLYEKGEWSENGAGYLSVTTLEFRVIEWSSARIVARYEAPVADFEIRISLSDRSVERSFRETKARFRDR
jgi:hypothetical protein